MSPAMTPDQVQEALKLRAQGVTYAVLAERYGVSIGGVHYRLDSRLPARERPVRRVTPDQIRRIRELRATGMLVADIAARVGVKPNVVTYHTTNQDTEPVPPPITADDLLLSAFPWAWRLTKEERAQFGYELAHRPKGAQERDTDRFISTWRIQAESRRS